ncbi:hypothetical protein OJAV_G00215780 [Oryzias javanicus]|uniref:SEFIR domain-containing protein n=1 Tax=Oryzias javanicus TaxID=123683 RepID=A0A437C437_ORYJA|nr:hypothetical protein OJAV_G00215780 [Oryzias javanicus]
MDSLNADQEMEKPEVLSNKVYVTEELPVHPNEAAQAWWMAARKFPERACQADVKQHKDRRRKTPTQMDLHHHQPFSPHSAEVVQGASSQEDMSWSFKPDLCYPPNTNTARTEDDYRAYTSNDEEELEAPLPLKDDYDWQQHQSFLFPPHSMHSWELHQDVHKMSCTANGGAVRWPPHFSPHSCQKWAEPENCCYGLPHPCSFATPPGSVSVNVPQFSTPPVDAVSQVDMLKLSSAAGESSSHLQGRTGTISLPDECRNVLITHSVDASSEIATFRDFLTKQGFRTITNLTDNPTGEMDIHKWRDTLLKDPSTLVIIAISPKYKADTERSPTDSHGLHTKYIHNMMQNEFIQEGCLNFRFIPVLFLGASQNFVPGWLQNTRVYRWPQDTEDLLLRLFRVERYIPPPVPVELAVIIRPVPMSATTMLRW